MMTVNYQVVRWLIYIATFAHVRTTVIGIGFVKAVLQVKIRVVNGLHYGIIDFRILNADPTDQIVVLLIKFCIFREHNQLATFRWCSWHGRFCFRTRFCLFNDLGKAFIEFFLLICFFEMTVYHHSAEYGNQQEE